MGRFQTVYFLSAILAGADTKPLFSLGVNNNSAREFGRESYRLEEAPGSANDRDDHFYLAGTYPDPIGVVNEDEPLDNFERTLTSSDPRIVVHFNLTPAQATNTGLMSFTVDFIWSRASVNGEDAPFENVVEISVNGKPASFTTTPFESYTTFNGFFSTENLDLVTGANTIELRRTGTTPGTWVALDRFEVSLDPRGFEDQDGDQLPRYWEVQNLLSDDEPADAEGDVDGDTLTARQEFQLGTNPRSDDTDRDGLTDQLEINSDPLDPDSDDDGLKDGEETNSSPVLVDTDDDGASDAWEIRTGFDPSDRQSIPPVWQGSIGINFRSRARRDAGLWPGTFPNGYIPQVHWNHTELLEDDGVSSGEPLHSGDTSNVALPFAGTIVDSAGDPTPTTVSFTFDGTRTSQADSTSAAQLLNGYLSADMNTPAELLIENIPASFATYDVYIYMAAPFLDRTASIRRDGSFTDLVFLRPFSTGAELEFKLFKPSSGPITPRANVVRFQGLTSRSVLFEAFRIDDDSSGIAAVQIINTSLDTNANSIPDWWELQNRIGPATQPDPDGDSLDWLAEYQAGSDPWNADTDGDGLTDSAEISAGTSPASADTDEDGLSDFDELNHPFASDPTRVDSDGDGLDDAAERQAHSDPSDSTVTGLPVPVFVSADEVLWEMTDLQFIINHGEGIRSGRGINRNFIDWQVDNVTSGTRYDFRLRLPRREGKIVFNVNARSSGSFNNDGRSFSHSDYDTDLTAAMGLAGFGSHDTTDPLTFRMRGVRDNTNPEHWTVTYGVYNQRTAQTVTERIFTERSASSIIDDESATWGLRDIPGSSELILSHGVSLFRTQTPIEQLRGLTDIADQDNDGMTDAFEQQYGFNSNDPNDAVLDGDNDGMSNVAEAIIGSNPGNRDTDNDGVPDGMEARQFSDPNSASSVPPLFLSTPPTSSDLNQNGLSDIWEAYFGAGGLNALADSDGDGDTNREEELFGTDPFDPTSIFRISSESNTTSGTSDFSFPRIDFKNLALLTSPTLSDFQPSDLTLQNEGDRYRVSVPHTPGSTFLRVSVRERDSDSDGLTDWEENTLGSSSLSPHSMARPVDYDSDGDGEADGTIAGDRALFLARFSTSSDDPARPEAPGRTAASRLLMQATFGPTLADIDIVRGMGIESWIDDQISNQPATYHENYIVEIENDLNGPRLDKTYRTRNDDADVDDSNLQSAFARAAVSGPDQLRQRVAFALSQILVISRQDGGIDDNVRSLARYYDRLVDHAFGNYYDLLLGVTLDSNMGRYLSHVGNLPPAPEISRFPDENYAREVMQLFSIGLWELNQDGTRKLDENGQPIPTYGNETITELARVMTGLWFSNNAWGRQSGEDSEHLQPLQLFPDYHDFRAKTLLNGFVIPARQPSVENGLQDIRDTIRHLVDHPNCAPFVSRSLIQFLVTSNPSPEYVARISSVFADNGAGERGDLGAVVKAILLDREARDPVIANTPDYGLLREPVIKTMHLARLTRLNRSGKLVWWDYGGFYEDVLQVPLYSPTVFNFYRPDYTPPGLLDLSGLDGPAFGIANSYTAISQPNRLWDITDRGFLLSGAYQFTPDYRDFMLHLDDSEKLLDYLNLVVCAGRMGATTRSVILTNLTETEFADPVEKARLALYLTLMSPEGAVQK